MWKANGNQELGFSHGTQKAEARGDARGGLPPRGKRLSGDRGEQSPALTRLRADRQVYSRFRGSHTGTFNRETATFPFHRHGNQPQASLNVGRVSLVHIH